jgi:AraC-like DNA-binding protein
MSGMITCGDGKDYMFGKTVYPQDGRWGPRLQSDYQLFVLLSGRLSLMVEDASHDLAPGEAILLHPGRQELFRFHKKGESAHSWCQVAPENLSRQDRGSLKGAVGVYKAPSSIHVLIEEGLSARSLDEASVHSALLALARACLLRFSAHACSLDHKTAAPPLHPALERALGFAAEHHAELSSAGDLARLIGISVNQLRFLCHQAKRESPTQMIWRLKAEHAIQMIRSTGLTLGEIAQSCGYTNAFHLSRSIKRHTGYSPRRLRQVEWNR